MKVHTVAKLENTLKYELKKVNSFPQVYCMSQSLYYFRVFTFSHFKCLDLDKKIQSSGQQRSSSYGGPIYA